MKLRLSLQMLLMVVACLLFSVGTVFAFPLYPGTPANPGTQFEDDNLDYFLDNDNDGLITVGDYLYSAIEFTRVLDLVGGAPAYSLNTAADELVAFAAIKLVDQSNPAAWAFGPINDRTPMVQVWSGGPVNLDLFTAGADPTLAQAQAAIFDGVHLWDFSVTADPDTFWLFLPNALVPGVNDPTIVGGLSSTVKVGTVAYQLEQVFGDPIFTDVVVDFPGIGGDGLTSMFGSGDLLGGKGLIGGAFARSDIDSTLNPIPEPSTLILLGAGLLGLAAMRKRSRKS